MVVNRNKRNKNNKSSNNKDFFGILLMIVSAIFLICLVIPSIFSIISEGIRYVILGLFGIFSYALFGGLFAVGLCIFLNKRVSISKPLLALGITDLMLLLIILQLATTGTYLSYEFGAYMAAVYDSNVTAGGAVFGLLAYAFSALMTTVVAYIVLIISMVVVTFFIGRKLYLKYMPVLAKRKEIKTVLPESDDDLNPERRVPDSFEPEYRSPRSYNPSSLFCERIVTKESRNADFVTDKNGQLQAEHFQTQPLQQQTTQQPAVDNTGRRMGTEEARSWLYDRDESEGTRSIDPSFRQQISQSLYAPSAPKSPSVSPIVPGRSTPYGVSAAEEYKINKPAQMPKKIVHENKYINSVVLPTPKPDIEYVAGDIINSTNLFKPYPQPENPRNERQTFASSELPQNTLSQQTSELPKTQSFGFITGDDDGVINSSMMDNFYEQPAQTYVSAPQPEPELPPIVSNTILSGNDYEYEEPEERAPYQPIKKEDLEAFEKMINPIITSNTYVDDDDEYDVPALEPKKYNPIKEPLVDENDSPIINSNYMASSASVPHKDLYSPRPVKPALEDRTNQYDIISDSSVVDEYPQVQEVARAQQPIRSSNFIIDDEVIDKTERDHDFGANDSGYYINDETTIASDSGFEEINRPKKTRQKSYEPIGGQLSIEDTIQSNITTEPIVRRAEPYYYNRPPMDLLLDPAPVSDADSEEIEIKRELIEATLSDLKYPAKIVNVIKGPTVTRYELQPPVGMSVRKILGKDSDIEYALATKGVRIEAPIAGKQAIGIEVPNKIRDIVYLKELLDCPEFTGNDAALPLALGKDLGGSRIIKTLDKMPHLLVAGATGTGKSVCLNALILSLMYHCSPEDMRMVLVDPKCVEFAAYRNLPHLLVPTPIIDPQHTINAFDWAIKEMNNRYQVFSANSVRNIGEYNKSADVRNGIAAKMPYIVFIVDELADLMLSRKREVEDRIRNITQKSRAAGIHLILATQRPSVDVITGTIKINLPCRIAFSVTTNPDSRTVLDQGGAESLIGNGDMLFMPQDSPDLKRLQGALVTNDEISSIVSYVIQNNKPIFDSEIENAIFKSTEPAQETAAAIAIEEESGDDKILPNIMRTLITSKSASTSMIQRRFAFGYARASRIIDIIEQRGWIGKMEGSKPREVFMTVGQFEEIFGRPFNEEE